jgi:hypothetical protein
MAEVRLDEGKRQVPASRRGQRSSSASQQQALKRKNLLGSVADSGRLSRVQLANLTIFDEYVVARIVPGALSRQVSAEF